MQKMQEEEEKRLVQLNLADLNLRFWGQEEWLRRFLLQADSRFLSIGSYFCEIYFFKTAGNLMSGSLDFLKDLKIRVTLVLPVFSQKNLDRAKETIKKILSEKQTFVNEITVNDIGMLKFINELKSAEQFAGRITAGRLFFKNFRNPAYGNYMRGSVELFFPEFLQGQVQAAECDIVAGTLSLSEFPENVEVYVHHPYTYISCGQVCEYACVSNERNLYYQTSAGCKTTCMQGYEHTWDGYRELIHIGKGVYFDVPYLKEISRQPERWLYWPLKEVFERKQIDAGK